MNGVTARRENLRGPGLAGSFMLTGLLLTAAYVATQKLSYREILVFVLGLAAVVVLLAGARGLRIGFVIAICTLGVGYRTLTVTPRLGLHPLELIIWGLLALMVAMAALRRSAKFPLRLPGWLWSFIPFWIWGWVVGLRSGYAWDLMWGELRNFLLLVPLCLLAGAVIQQRAWRPVFLAYYCTGSWIALMGVVEYLFPELKDVAPQFVSHPLPVSTLEGFERANFSFWGHQAAVFVCLLALPLALPIWRWWPAAGTRVLTLVAASVQIWGIYIAGYRVVWLLVGLQLLLLFAFTRRYVLAGAAILACLLGYQTTPSATQERVRSLVLILRGAPLDTSGMTHLSRPRDAFDAAIKHPTGLGWGGAGWVHCDFLQIAANLGIAAGIVFAGAYVFTFFRLARRIRFRARLEEQQLLRLALLLSFLAAGGLLATQVIGVLPQLAAPVWLIWVFAEVHLRQTKELTSV